MHYFKYQNVRDLSWQVLIDNNISELPVKVTKICANMGIPVISYEKGDKIIKLAGLQERCSQSDGLAFNGMIFYNQECGRGRQRFTIAHELGHILLHSQGINNIVPPREKWSIEKEANVFASRILAPACVLWGLRVKTADEISRICDISIEASKIRMERLKVLYEREQEFKQKKGKNCFLLSQAEKTVYDQFYDYIRKNRL